jgi:hypothetical protein
MIVEPTRAIPPRTPVGIFEIALEAIPPTPGIMPATAPPIFLMIEKKPGSPV